MNIFICETYYHLLISMIKNIHCENKNDLIIFGDRLDNSLVDNKILISHLIESQIFRKIYILDYKQDFKRYSHYGVLYQIHRYFFINSIKKNIEKTLIDYHQIYLFNDISTIGKCINKLHKKYILLEDGLDCFQNNHNIIEINSSFKRIIKQILYGSSQLGQSKNIEYIEVNNKNNIFIKNKKIIEAKKDNMFNALSLKDKQLIFNIFSTQINLNYTENYSLMITQPLYNDGLLSSLDEQISIYRYIANHYIKEEKLIIKTHPRENIDYLSYFPNAIILDKNFPIEIISFQNKINFHKIITVSSTSIEMIHNCNQKLKLGWDWLEQIRKEYHNEQES